MSPGFLKTWLLSEYFYPECVSTGYYITEIAKYFSNSGIHVAVISSQNKYRGSEVGDAQQYELYDGIEIFRATVTHRNSKNSLIKRSITMLHTTTRMFLLMIKHIRKSDNVIAVTNPPLLILCLYMLKLFRGIRYTIIIHDLFPENLISLNVLSRRNIFYKLLRVLFFYLYSQASNIITIGRDMQNVINKNIHKVKTKIVTITNWADDDIVYPVEPPQNSIISEQHLQGKIVLQFAGNIGRAQNIEILLKIANDSYNNNFLILFIGTGEKAGLIKKYINDNDRKNVEYLDYIDRSKQCEFLNLCDIGLVTLRDGMYGLGVPSKAYNIMAAGKPIFYIGDKGSEIFQLICENDIGWAFQANDYSDILKTLDSLTIYSEDICRKGKNARKIAETLYNKYFILKKYLNVLR